MKQLLLLNEKKLDIVTEVNLDNKNYSIDLFKKIKRIQTITESSASGINDSCGKLNPTAGKMLKGIEKDTYGIYSNGSIKRDDKDLIVKSC